MKLRNLKLPLIVSSLLAGVYLYAHTYTINTGWNLIGAVNNTESSSFTNIPFLWVYKDGTWSVTSPDSSMNSAITNSGYNSEKLNLNAGDGFWVYSPTTQIITIDTVDDTNDINDTNSTIVPSNVNYNIEQAISDRAQETTIAYSALAFFTGNGCADSFIPPGKVADFFGFQYLRDNTPDGLGHSTDFLTNTANNVLSILNDEQKQLMIEYASSQADLVNEYAHSRYPLLGAFRTLLEGTLSSGKTALSKEAVIDYSEKLYLIDANISIQRAKLFGNIIRSLDNSQKSALDTMVQGGFTSWEALEDQVDKTTMSHDKHVLVMTYASEIFGWYAGSIEADTYFCPERHGTYFGSFYMKDAPALAAQQSGENYVIDETITGNKGEELLNYLEPAQSQKISDIVDLQKNNLTSIVNVRESISTELRKFMIQESIDEELILSLVKNYGAYDGENVYNYANNFSEVMKTLTDTQKSDLMELRDLDEYTCSQNNVFVYSEGVEKSSIDSSYFDTDFLFE